MIFKKTKRIICLVTVFIFALSDFARAGLPVEKNPSFKLSLPGELGTVQETYLSDFSEEAPFIIHLQTPHAHYESALQIKKIIQYLKKRYHIDFVFAEGASEALHPEFLHFFEDSRLNQKMAEALAQKGELTGVDLSLLDPGIRATGIEDPELYRAAYREFKKVIENLDDNQASLDQAKMKLDRQASRIFSPRLRKLVGTWEKFNSEKREISATAKFLSEESKKSLRLDFEDAFSQFEWPQFTRLVLLTELERKIDQGALEKEKQKLVDWLHGENIPSDFLQTLESDQSVGSRDFYKNFLREAYPRGFRFGDYPQITYLAASRVLKSELEASSLFGEFARLFDKLFKTMTKTQEEKSLLEKYKKLFLLQKLFRLELTRAEWKESKIAPSQKMSSPRRFYLLTERRESIFLKNIKQEMEKRHVKKAILVTGGFHADGLAELFRENGIGFTTVTPRVSGEMDSSLYHQIMLRQAHLEKPEFLQSAGVFGNRNYLRAEIESVKAASEKIGTIDLHAPYFLDRESFLQRDKGRAEVRQFQLPPVEELRQRLSLPYKDKVGEFIRGNGWIRISATPKEAYWFYNTWSKKIGGTHETTSEGKKIIFNIDALRKAAHWFRGNEEFERVGFFVAERKENEILITDFIPVPSYVMDPTLSTDIEIKQNLRILNFPREVEDALGLSSRGYELFFPNSKSLIPIHSHPAWSHYPKGPSKHDVTGMKPGTVEFVFGLAEKVFSIYNSDGRSENIYNLRSEVRNATEEAERRFYAWKELFDKTLDELAGGPYKNPSARQLLKDWGGFVLGIPVRIYQTRARVGNQNKPYRFEIVQVKGVPRIKRLYLAEDITYREILELNRELRRYLGPESFLGSGPALLDLMEWAPAAFLRVLPGRMPETWDPSQKMAMTQQIALKFYRFVHPDKADQTDQALLIEIAHGPTTVDQMKAAGRWFFDQPQAPFIVRLPGTLGRTQDVPDLIKIELEMSLLEDSLKKLEDLKGPHLGKTLRAHNRMMRQFGEAPWSLKQMVQNYRNLFGEESGKFFFWSSRPRQKPLFKILKKVVTDLRMQGTTDMNLELTHLAGKISHYTGGAERPRIEFRFREGIRQIASGAFLCVGSAIVSGYFLQKLGYRSSFRHRYTRDRGRPEKGAVFPHSSIWVRGGNESFLFDPAGEQPILKRVTPPHTAENQKWDTAVENWIPELGTAVWIPTLGEENPSYIVPFLQGAYSSLLYNLSSWYNREPEEREATLLKIRKIDPASSDAAHQLAKLYLEEDRYDEAIALLQQAIALNPDVRIFWVGLGTVLGDKATSLDDPKKAIHLLRNALKAYRKALELSPSASSEILLNFSIVYGWLALIYQELGETRRAHRLSQGTVDYLKKAMLLNPQNLQIWSLLADIYRQQGYEEAARWIDETLHRPSRLPKTEEAIQEVFRRFDYIELFGLGAVDTSSIQNFNQDLYEAFTKARLPWSTMLAGGTKISVMYTKGASVYIQKLDIRDLKEIRKFFAENLPNELAESADKNILVSEGYSIKTRRRIDSPHINLEVTVPGYDSLKLTLDSEEDDYKKFISGIERDLSIKSLEELHPFQYQWQRFKKFGLGVIVIPHLIFMAGIFTGVFLGGVVGDGVMLVTTLGAITLMINRAMNFIRFLFPIFFAKREMMRFVENHGGHSRSEVRGLKTLILSGILGLFAPSFQPLLAQPEKTSPKTVQKSQATPSAEVTQKEIDRLIERLALPDYAFTGSDRRSLIKIGKPAVPALIKVLENEKEQTGKKKYEVIRILGEIKDLRAVSVLTEIAKNQNDPDFRKIAIEALVKMRARSAIPLLIEQFKNNSVEQHKAAQVLGEMKAREAVPVLIESLLRTYRSKPLSAEYSDADVQANALRDIGSPTALFFYFLYHENISEASKIKHAPDLAVKILNLHKKKFHIGVVWRQGALKILLNRELGKEEIEKAIPVLIETLRSENVAELTKNVLEKIGGPAVPALIEILKENEYHPIEQKSLAAEALSNVLKNNPEAIPIFIEGAKKEGFLRREVALETLPALAELMKSPNPYIQRMAIQALGELKTPEAVPVLIESLLKREAGRGGDMEAEALKTIGSPKALFYYFLHHEKITEASKIEESTHLAVELISRDSYRLQEQAFRVLLDKNLDQEEIREIIPILIGFLHRHAHDFSEIAEVRLVKSFFIKMNQPDRVVSALIDDLKTSSDPAFYSFDILESFKDRVKVSDLIEIEKKHGYIKGEMRSYIDQQVEEKVKSLIENMGLSAIPALLEALNDKDFHIQRLAQEVIDKQWKDIGVRNKWKYYWVTNPGGMYCASGIIFSILFFIGVYVKLLISARIFLALGRQKVLFAQPGLLKLLKWEGRFGGGFPLFYTNALVVETLGSYGNQMSERALRALAEILDSKKTPDDLPLGTYKDLVAKIFKGITHEVAVTALINALSSHLLNFSHSRTPKIAAESLMATPTPRAQFFALLYNDQAEQASKVNNAFDYAIEASKQENPKIRAGAMTVFHYLGKEESSPYLIERLADSSPDVRTLAIEALRVLSSPPAQFYTALYEGRIVEALHISQAKQYVLEALTHKNADLRGNAALAAAELKDEILIPNLMAGLKDPNNVSVFGSFTTALAKMSSAVHPYLIQRLKEVMADVQRSIEEENRQLSQSIGDYDDYGNYIASQTAAEVKEKIMNEKVVPVIQVIGKIGPSMSIAIPQLGDLLANHQINNATAAAIAHALGEIRDPVTLPILFQALDFYDALTAIDVFEALSKFDDPKAKFYSYLGKSNLDAAALMPDSISSALKAMQSKNLKVHSNAIRLLALKKVQTIVPELIEKLSMPFMLNEELAATMAYALGEIRDPAALPVLLKALAGLETFRYHSLLPAVAESLSKFDDPKAKLYAFLYQQKIIEASRIPDTEGYLEEILKDVKNPRIQFSAEAVRRFKKGTLLAFLLETLKHSQKTQMAEEILRQTKNEFSVPALIEPLIQILKPGNDGARQATFRLLCDILRENPKAFDLIKSYHHEIEELFAIHFVQHGFSESVLKAGDKTSLIDFVTLGAKIGAGTSEKKIALATSDPTELAKWITANKSTEGSNELQVSIGYDTGILPSQEERGKFISTFLFIATTYLNQFQGLQSQPKRDPRAAYGMLIRGQVVQTKHPGQKNNKRLDYIFNLSNEMTERSLTEHLRQIQLLNLGLLLASAEDSFQRFFPGQNPSWMDQKMKNIAETYRIFESRLVSLLREHNQYRDPGKIYKLKKESDEERISAFQKHLLEEALYPTYHWLVPLSSQDDQWEKLTPLLRTIESMMLHIGASEKVASNPQTDQEERFTRGENFIRQVRNLGYQTMEEMERILRGDLPEKEAPSSRDPFIDSAKYPELTLNYLQHMVDALQDHQISLDHLSHPEVFQAAVQYYGVTPSTRSEIRITSLAQKSFLTSPRLNRRETVPREEPEKVPQTVPAPAPAPQPAPSPQPAPARPAEPVPAKPDLVPAGVSVLSIRSEARGEKEDEEEKIKELILRMGNKREHISAAAAVAIVMRGKAAIPALRRALKNGNSRLRENADWALQRIREEQKEKEEKSPRSEVRGSIRAALEKHRQEILERRPNLTELAKITGIKIPNLSSYFRTHPEDVEEFQIEKGPHRDPPTTFTKDEEIAFLDQSLETHLGNLALVAIDLETIYKRALGENINVNAQLMFRRIQAAQKLTQKREKLVSEWGERFPNPGEKNLIRLLRNYQGLNLFVLDFRNRHTKKFQDDRAFLKALRDYSYYKQDGKKARPIFTGHNVVDMADFLTEIGFPVDMFIVQHWLKFLKPATYDRSEAREGAAKKVEKMIDSSTPLFDDEVQLLEESIGRNFGNTALMAPGVKERYEKVFTEHRDIPPSLHPLINDSFIYRRIIRFSGPREILSGFLAHSNEWSSRFPKPGDRELVQLLERYQGQARHVIEFRNRHAGKLWDDIALLELLENFNYKTPSKPRESISRRDAFDFAAFFTEIGFPIDMFIAGRWLDKLAEIRFLRSKPPKDLSEEDRPRRSEARQAESEESLKELGRLVVEAHLRHLEEGKPDPVTIIFKGNSGTSKTRIIRHLRAALEDLEFKVEVEDQKGNHKDSADLSPLTFEKLRKNHPGTQFLIYEGVNEFPRDPENLDLLIRTTVPNDGIRQERVIKREIKLAKSKAQGDSYAHLYGIYDYAIEIASSTEGSYSHKPDLEIDTTGQSGHPIGEQIDVTKLLADRMREILASAPRSEVRRAERLAFDLPFLNFSPAIAADFPILTAFATLGIASADWNGQETGRYRSLLEDVIAENILAGQTFESYSQKVKILEDAKKDGVHFESTAGDSPVALLIDSKALDPKDQKEIRLRLGSLPEGSVVIEYVDPNQAGILSPLIREFPMLKYSRRIYQGQIKMAEIREVLLDRQNNTAMRQHIAILFSHSEGLENLELKNLGIAAFQFDRTRLPENYRSLPGLSAAIFGEVAEYAKLGRDLNQRALQANRALGLFGFRNGVYSFLSTWFDARTSETLLSVSA